MTTHTIKCAKCNLALQGPADPEPDDALICPGCGMSDTLENVTREIGEYVTECMAEAIGGTVRDAFRGTEFIEVTTDHRHQTLHRFVVDLDL